MERSGQILVHAVTIKSGFWAPRHQVNVFLPKSRRRAHQYHSVGQKKTRHAAFYRSPTKVGADALKKGNLDVLTLLDYFSNQRGLPIQVAGQTIGGIAASGAKPALTAQA
jgi:glc operon protein GlcG